jgi:hypothetical protein
MRRALALLLLAVAPATALAAFPEDQPNDPLYDASPLPNSRQEQWDLTTDRGISVDRAWALSTGKGMVIADIDVGVDPEHEDLKGRFTDGFDFFMNDATVTSETSNAHGTNVAGVLGAAADNGIGIAGIAPDARIMPVRTADNILHQGARLAAGIVWATDHGADVISMSLGAESRAAALDRAVRYAHRRGVVMVAAIGNESANHHNYPATYDEVIAVGGINPDTADAAAQGALEPQTPVAADFTVRAAYSDYGPHIDVVAPTQVPTTNYGGGYQRNWSGTSAATPHVAGVAALVKAARPGLTPVQVRQLITRTADDLSGEQNGHKAGWDQFTGYGRVNAYEAVRAAKEGRVPPEADITSPDLFATKRGPFRVRVMAGARWQLVRGPGEEPGDWTVVGEGSAGRHSVKVRPGDGSRGWTLRLQASGPGGAMGEDRAFYYSNRDRALKRGYPLRLGSSGESSPVLADLTGDRVAEIVLGTTDGRVRAWNGRTRRLVRGWPRRSGTAFASRSAARRIGRTRAGFIGTPAVADIAGSRRPEVVASALDGRVYAWHHDGRRVRGFPARIDARRPPSPERDVAIYASPALAQLDGRGKLDVVVGAGDGKVYAWNGRGRRLAGWPVEARDGEDRERVVSSPAVGDIDGDEQPDVVEASAEVYGSTPQTEGRVYAWDAQGKPKPGWPIKPPALAADAIPIAGEGTPASPSLADVDGDGADEVAIAAFTGQPDLYRGDGSAFDGDGQHFTTTGRGSTSRTTAASALALGSNGAFGRFGKEGPLGFFSGLVDTRFAAASQMPAQRLAYEHILGGWDAVSGEYLSAFPATVEQFQIITGPAVADVDGDGRAEVIAGTSGLLLHAFKEDGEEAAGWPKQTGGWLFASPAVGDVDGDRKLEVVAVTREGYMFVWDTPTRAPGLVEWGSFRHDARNSGRYDPRVNEKRRPRDGDAASR